MAKKQRTRPGPVWVAYMEEAVSRLTKAGSWRDAKGDAYAMIGEEIVRFGDGEKFLKSVRRGRSTQRQNARYQIMRVVENAIGSAVPRRREDANTPESSKVRVRARVRFEGTLFSPEPEGGYFTAANNSGVKVRLRPIHPPTPD